MIYIKFCVKKLVFNTFATLHLAKGHNQLSTGMYALALSATATLFSGVDPENHQCLLII